jgi:hypothetical protein
MSIDWRQMVEGLVREEEQIEIAQLQSNMRLLIGRREVPRMLEACYNDFFEQNQRNNLLEILDYCSNNSPNTIHGFFPL